MKFAKFKIKRCKDCIYYKKIGDNIHYCKNNIYYKKYGFDNVLTAIPLICFKKQKNKRRINE